MAQTNSRDINAVLRAHDRELLAINGVVGVYVGALDDGKTPCLKVMVVSKTAELERAIPKTLEGYPIVIEVTGEGVDVHGTDHVRHDAPRRRHVPWWRGLLG